jgi:transketolase
MKKLREEFADTMLEIGSVDPRLVVMVGDISHGILQPYAKACPGRYYNIGICEPTIVNMAAGLSKSGLIPVVHTIAPFIIERAYEQIKLDLGYQNLDANLISVGGAFDYAQLGCSHHCYADISLMSHFKRAQVLIPGTPKEFNCLFKEIYAQNKINYLRLSEFSHGVDFDESQIRVGKAIKVQEGRDLTIVTTGPQLKSAMEAIPLLHQAGINPEILYYHSIKPFDGEMLHTSVSKTGNVITVEELSAHDGLFNQVVKSSLAIDKVNFSQLAIEDFVHGYGSYEELCQHLGLCAAGILHKVRTDFPQLLK